MRKTSAFRPLVMDWLEDRLVLSHVSVASKAAVHERAPLSAQQIAADHVSNAYSTFVTNFTEAVNVDLYAPSVSGAMGNETFFSQQLLARVEQSHEERGQVAGLPACRRTRGHPGPPGDQRLQLEQPEEPAERPDALEPGGRVGDLVVRRHGRGGDPAELHPRQEGSPRGSAGVQHHVDIHYLRRAAHTIVARSHDLPALPNFPWRGARATRSHRSAPTAPLHRDWRTGRTRAPRSGTDPAPVRAHQRGLSPRVSGGRP